MGIRNVQNILVVDDEPLMRDFVGETLSRLGCEVRYAQDGIVAARLLDQESFDLVFTDMKLPKMSGLDVLKKARAVNPEIFVVVMTAYGTVETAVEAMKSGACDYLLKPFTPDQVEFLVSKVSELRSLKAENAYLKREIDQNFGLGEIVGQSQALKEIYQTIQKVANSKANVLITGESGTGKELAARAIHFQSERKNKPFIKLNCAALPSNLIESELFGHEKGSFTGAVTQRLGRFELAHEGTLFLDEVSEIELSLQAKLLRVLQEREFERVGSAKTVKVDVRILASSNRNLKAEVAGGKFREDLYYRLNVVPLILPPLRERKGDLRLLAEHFLKWFSGENKKKDKLLSPEAWEALLAYDWPGNVRELENVIERAVVMDRDKVIEPRDLGLTPSLSKKSEGSPDEDFCVGKSMAEVEKNYILKTLDHCQKNRTKTAEVLDISIRTLRNKLHEYGWKEE